MVSAERKKRLCRVLDPHRILCHRVPVTKLGRLVKDGKIRSIEEIYLFSMPVKEFQVIDLLLPKLKGAHFRYSMR